MPELFELTNLLQQQAESGRPYHEFLRHKSMSAGIYRLDAGEPDRQQPHREDELYYVLAGTGAIEIQGDRTTVTPGSVVFVPKDTPHHFLDYPDGLTLFVMFAPAQQR